MEYVDDGRESQHSGQRQVGGRSQPGARLRKLLRSRLVLGCVVASFVMIAGGVILLMSSSQHSPFSKDIISSVNFPLYYPTSFPTGYQIDPNSITSNSQAVLYQI